MDAPVRSPQDESIGELVSQLIDDGRALARAEIDLYREIALHRAGRAKTGIAALAAGAVLLLSALTALVVGVVLGLAGLIGPVGAGLAVAVFLAAAGYFLVRWGAAGLGALSGDDEERSALSRVETLQ